MSRPICKKTKENFNYNISLKWNYLSHSPASVFVNGTCYWRTGYHANSLNQQHQTVGTSEIVQIDNTDQYTGREREWAGERESKDDAHQHHSVIAGDQNWHKEHRGTTNWMVKNDKMRLDVSTYFIFISFLPNIHME